MGGSGGGGGRGVGNESTEHIKPVYLKGLFSVSTTSSKPLPYIRADIIRVLKQLGVAYAEIKGGFSCRHAPSIDLHKLQDVPGMDIGAGGAAGGAEKHRRRISFGGFNRGAEREREREELRAEAAYQQQQQQQQQRSSSRRRGGAAASETTRHPDTSFTNSEDDSDDEEMRAAASRRRGQQRGRPAGETSTHVESDLGESLVLKFEMVVVKVPLLSLHGIQFKKVAGGTWQYKEMASKILDALRL